MAVIELKNVWKEFSLEREKEMTLKERFVNLGKRKKEEKIVALKNINLSVERGECLGILGKNGSGKTTLLKIIAGILKPNRGSVRVEGKIAPILALGLGFQRELTAKENLYLYASILGLDKKKTDEIYEKIVKFSELEKMMDVKLKDFSDGMIMRLSFSIAFHIDADIILIDEVLAVGDASFQAKCLEKIKQLKEEGKTIVIVLHTTAEIRKLCNRALILEKGEIIFSGQASEVCEKYDEIIENERLKRFNEMVMEETGIKFNVFCEEEFILKKGKKCLIEVKIDKPIELLELFFVGRNSVRVFSKNLDNGKIVFQIDSLPLPQDEYEVWIRHEGKFLSQKPFKVIVKGWEESRENKIYMLPSSSYPFQDLTVVFGENPEKEMKMFEEGKTIFIFSNLEKIDEKENACLFSGRKLLLKGRGEHVLRELKEKVWHDLATRYFSDILMNNQVGKVLMGVS
ncbi:MAG: ABC transporter ATP-binding protein [Candidatus Aenigmatarchaeota archaeon]